MKKNTIHQKQNNKKPQPNKKKPQCLSCKIKELTYKIRGKCHILLEQYELNVTLPPPEKLGKP